MLNQTTEHTKSNARKHQSMRHPLREGRPGPRGRLQHGYHLLAVQKEGIGANGFGRS